jgi:hypothetical protein
MDQRRPEFHDIAPESVGVNTNLLIPSAHEHIGAQCLAKKSEGLVEGVAGEGPIEIGPEEVEQLVTAVQAWGASRGQVADQRQPLRLPEE